MVLNGGKWYMKKIAVVLLALNLLIENFSYNTLFKKKVELKNECMKEGEKWLN